MPRAGPFVVFILLFYCSAPALDHLSDVTEEDITPPPRIPLRRTRARRVKSKTPSYGKYIT